MTPQKKIKLKQGVSSIIKSLMTYLKESLQLEDT